MKRLESSISYPIFCNAIAYKSLDIPNIVLLATLTKRSNKYISSRFLPTSVYVFRKVEIRPFCMTHKYLANLYLHELGGNIASLVGTNADFKVDETIVALRC
jgi:hypothetical protein